MSLARDGYLHLPHDPAVARWAAAAAGVAADLDLTERRHGGTWFVGVDALPNDASGGVAGVPLAGAWADHVSLPATWHRAQVSIVWPGYPGRDAGESDAAHAYRRDRDAAHLDGLLPEGPDKRRHLREPHGFILGLPLGDVADSPLVVWPGSHRIMGDAMRAALADVPPDGAGDVDLTDIYQAARRQVFATCPRVELPARRGEVTLLHRHVLHGVAPWGAGGEPRAIAYFRPLVPVADWLKE